MYRSLGNYMLSEQLRQILREMKIRELEMLRFLWQNFLWNILLSRRNWFKFHTKGGLVRANKPR